MEAPALDRRNRQKAAGVRREGRGGNHAELEKRVRLVRLDVAGLQIWQVEKFYLYLRSNGNISPCIRARVTWSYLSHHDFLAALGMGRPAKSLLPPTLERWEGTYGPQKGRTTKGEPALCFTHFGIPSPLNKVCHLLCGINHKNNTDGGVLPCPVTGSNRICILCVFCSLC